ncbi:hypothetical protein N7523_000029 [Penicillium sp. IBT 18751x]|nr:hypothetical protein N7523_000029 [Penicillium sp. IBT 18751x]
MQSGSWTTSRVIRASGSDAGPGEEPLGADWKKDIDALRQETLQIKQDINAVRIFTDHSQNRTRSFAEAVRQAPAPAHYLSEHGSGSSPRINRSELGGDREVIIHLGDADAVKRYRGMTAKDIKKRAERVKVEAALRQGVPTLASVAFVAVRVLMSGDICFMMRSAKEAEIARTHQGWTKGLCKEAKVHLPTWGIIVHDVNVRTLGINNATELQEPQHQQRLIKELETSNRGTWGEEAKVIKLRGQEGHRPEYLIGDDSLTTILYDRAARIRQCHHCQQYGHIGSTCPNGAKCVFCADEHLSRECERRQNGLLIERKCANCGGAHAGWSRRCEAFRKEVERVEIRRATRPRYHRVPAHISISQQSVGSRSEESAPSAPSRETGSESSGSGASSSARSSSGEQTYGGRGLVRSVSGLQSSQQAGSESITFTNASRVPRGSFKTSTKGGTKGKNKRGVRAASEPMDTAEDQPQKPLVDPPVDSCSIADAVRAIQAVLQGGEDEDEEVVIDEGRRKEHELQPIIIDESSTNVSINDQDSDYRPSTALSEGDANATKDTTACRAAGKENDSPTDPPIFSSTAKSTKSAPAGRSRPMKQNSQSSNTTRTGRKTSSWLMRDPTVLEAGVIAIQEPWANPFQETTHHPAKQSHQLLYPQADETGGERTRVCFFVSKKLDGWTHVVHSRDCQELRLRHQDRELRIFNAGSLSTLELVFASASLDGRMIDCRVVEDIHADSDHLPVCTILDFETAEAADAPKRRNWKSMDEDKFLTFVNTNLQDKPWLHLPGKVHPRWIDDATDYLMDVVQRGIQELTPWARPSQRANPGFTPEYRSAVKTTRRLRRKHTISQDEGDWQEYTKARNRKGKILKIASRTVYRKWIKELTEKGPKGLWKVGKWARSREASSGSIIPALKRPDGTLADTNEAKVDVLRDVFFPQPPTPDLDDIQRDTREVEQIPFPPVSMQEVRDAIRRAPPDKAPGDDTVPNRVWRLLAADDNSPFCGIIRAIFDACLCTGYNPRRFQTSITVTLRKGGPKDYRMPKLYRPVALLNTLGKLLESIVATRIAWAAEEKKGILPKGHLGGRTGVSIDHAIQLILDRVHQAWGIDRKVSMLLLDVSRAPRPLRAVDPVILARQEHSNPTSGFLSDPIPTPTGIPQGSPISPILFHLFNTPLVRGCTLHSLPCGGSAHAFGWVDDVCIVVISEIYARNIEILQQSFGKAAIWAKRHSAKFAPDKFELIHFSNPRQPPPPVWIPRQPRDIYEFYVEERDDHMPLELPGQTITPSSHAKYLGVWLDKHLDFTTHRNKVIAKANGRLEAFRGITGSTWGTSMSSMRKVYRAVVIPQLFWGLAAWFSPASGNMLAAERSQVIRELTRIQKRAALMISGAFKGTSAAALDIELFLTQINLLMQQTIEETAIRIQTGVPWAIPDGINTHTKRKPKERKLGGMTPLEALKWRKNGPLAPWKFRGQEVRCAIEEAEAAIQTHDDIELDAALADRAIQRIFTDGSGYAGLVGASAVGPTSSDWQQRHLGSLDYCNVMRTMSKNW